MHGYLCFFIEGENNPGNRTSWEIERFRNDFGDKAMLTKTTIALAAAAVFGVVSLAQANDSMENDRGGYRIGPLGQHFGGRFLPGWRHGGAYFGFAHVPGHRRVWHHEVDHR